MKNRLLNIILLSVMAVMITACAKPKKPDIEPIITEQDTIDDVDPISDPETEARKNRWSAGEMDR
jgi:hypothetical protein